MELKVRLKKPHSQQRAILDTLATRRIIRAGRRSGKTTCMAIMAVEDFLAGHRVLYATPTIEQIEKFWFEVRQALDEPINAGILYKHEGRHLIEVPGTEQRIRAKTAWNADTLRGDWCSRLILDEFQMMNPDAWELVGAPMLLDKPNGTATFIYTPPSISTSYRSRARDPCHAAKMFKEAKADETGRWAAFHFTSHDNPHISKIALGEIASDMTDIAYRQEIMAEDIEDAPGALWKRGDIDHVLQAPPLLRVVVAVDPTGSKHGDACGIVTGGMAIQKDEKHWYTIADDTLQGTPAEWGRAVVTAYHKAEADIVVAEANYGGEMVTHTIATIDASVPVKLVHASRGKQVRAEPVSTIYAQGRGHHVGEFPALEDELCQWETGQASPNRLDALVWGVTETLLEKQRREVRSMR